MRPIVARCLAWVAFVVVAAVEPSLRRVGLMALPDSPCWNVGEEVVARWDTSAGARSLALPR
jgi:hypothetical protein